PRRPRVSRDRVARPHVGGQHHRTNALGRHRGERRGVIARAATLFVFVAGWIVIFRYRSEHMMTKLAAATPAERRWIPLTTAVVSLHVSLAELLITLPFFGPAPTPTAIETRRWLAGIAIYLVGLALWFWTRRALAPLDCFVDTVTPPPRL